MIRVAIDPGHGMSNRTPGRFDPGAVNLLRRIRECDLALEWAKTLKFILHGKGIQTFYTRYNNEFQAPLGVRASRAMQAGCTHFISLHFDANILPTVSGCSTFYRDAEDLAFAKMVHPAALNAMNGKDRGVKHESKTRVGKLAVLAFDGPACLVEPGFITNARDLEMAMKQETRIVFAQAVARGLFL